MPGEGKNDADLERIPKTYTNTEKRWRRHFCPGRDKNDADLERIPKTYTQKRIRQTKPPPTPVLPGGPADPDRHIVQVDPDKIQVIQTRSTRGYPRGALDYS